MRFEQEFEISKMPEPDSFAPIPAGTYQVKVETAEIMDTKAMDGKYLKIKHRIVGGQFDNRVIFNNINFRNRNPDAERIGAQRLGELMLAGKLNRLVDTDQLIGVVAMAKVTVRTSEQYGDSNEIKGYAPLGGQLAPQAAPAAPQPPAAQPQRAASAPPWATR